MPLKLNVGLQKKLGLPDYGSIGATCHVEIELSASALDDPEGFRRQVRGAYAACTRAVEEELAQHKVAPNGSGPANGHNGHNGTSARSNGNGNVGNGNGGQMASEKQLVYTRQLAGQVKGLGVRGLENLAQRMYGKPLAAITGLEASGLIDTLKEIKAGKIDLEAVLKGATQ